MTPKRGALTLETARRIRFRQHPTLTVCWIWTGRIDPNGHPRWHHTGTSTTARVSVYRQLRGTTPERMTARCQESLCVNPNRMEACA